MVLELEDVPGHALVIDRERGHVKVESSNSRRIAPETER
jgi:hypothetical protein